MEISYTRYRIYRECPWKYKLLFVDGRRIPPNPKSAFGLSVHRALETWLGAGDDSLDALLDALRARWQAGGYPDEGAESRWYAKAERVLTRFHGDEMARRARPIAIEKEFTWPLGKHTVRGMIDRIDQGPDGAYELIDYKTGPVAPTLEQLKADLQLRYYALGADRGLGVRVANPDRGQPHRRSPDQHRLRRVGGGGADRRHRAGRRRDRGRTLRIRHALLPALRLQERLRPCYDRTMNLTARNWLVVASFAVSAALGLALARGGGAPAAGPSSRLLIGLSLDTLKEERWQRDKTIFEAKAKELGVDLLVQAANSDDTRQMQDVQALISRRVGAIIIAPHNGAAMAKAVDLAHEAGIPVISYDRLITDAPDLDLYVAFDAVRIGEMQAQALITKLKGRRPVRLVRIQGAKSDHNSFLLKEGQDRILSPLIAKGEVKVVHEDWAQDWKPENAKKIMNAALTTRGHDIDAVLCANDGTAGGAIQALDEEGMADKVVVVGQDAELVACQRVAAGTQAATIYKPTIIEVTAALEAAIKMAKGRPVVARDEMDNGKAKIPTILKDTIAVTRENLLATVVKDGYHSYDDVYKGVPADQRPKRP
ncbi:MAG: substrate-binding domain-containing protein [Elusimicrobiota bacterium]